MLIQTNTKILEAEAAQMQDFLMHKKCVWQPGSARTRWGSSQRSPRPPSCVWGKAPPGRGKGMGREREGRRGEGREKREGEKWERVGEEGKERAGKGVCPSNFYRCPPLSNSWRRP